MSIPDAPLELSAEEQAELDWLSTQPRFHVQWKCGKPLEVRNDSTKRHTRLHRYFCTVHQVLVDLGGWEVHWNGGEYSPGLNKK